MTVNSSCKFLSNGLKFQIRPNQKEVEIKPCCKWYGPGILLNDNGTDIHDFRSRIGNQHFHQIPECNVCVEYEKIGARSMRQAADLMIAANSEWGDPTHVEIQLDSTCNAACIMCGPNLSSLWRQELGWQKNVDFQPMDFDPIKAICQQIDIQKIRSINFVGGEPMLSRSDIEILESINCPELVTLIYVTNGSIYPPEQKQHLWQRFKKVRIVISLDGVGSRYNYIRYPLQWSKVNENLKLMQDKLPSVIFGVIYTANILNFYYFDEFDHWFRNAGLTASEPVYNIAHGVLTPNGVPAKLYQMIIDKYGYQHFVTRTVTHLVPNSSKTLEYLQQIDQRRSTNWHDIFPEVANALAGTT